MYIWKLWVTFQAYARYQTPTIFNFIAKEEFHLKIGDRYRPKDNFSFEQGWDDIVALLKEKARGGLDFHNGHIPETS